MKLRTERKLSQKAFAEQLQLVGYEFSDLTVLRIKRQVCPQLWSSSSGKVFSCILWIPLNGAEQKISSSLLLYYKLLLIFCWPIADAPYGLYVKWLARIILYFFPYMAHNNIIITRIWFLPDNIIYLLTYILPELLANRYKISNSIWISPISTLFTATFLFSASIFNAPIWNDVAFPNISEQS